MAQGSCSTASGDLGRPESSSTSETLESLPSILQELAVTNIPSNCLSTEQISQAVEPSSEPTQGLQEPNQLTGDSLRSLPRQGLSINQWIGRPAEPVEMSSRTLSEHSPTEHQVLREPVELSKSTKRTLSTVANVKPPHTVAAGTLPPSLPPSVEEAYRKKCIELKRRMNEVEESNDVYRLRKARLQRGIRKMRLERAYLLEILGKRMKKNGNSLDGFQGVYDEDSEGSSEAPPTPNEKPLRSKRSHRRPVSSPPPSIIPRAIAPHQSHPTSAFDPPRDPFRESQYQHVPTTNGHPAIHYQPPPPQHPGVTNMHGIPHPDQSRVILPTPFQMFHEKYILGNPDVFPARSDDEAVDIARQAWADPQYERYRLACEDLYEENQRRVVEERNEHEREKALAEQEELQRRDRREEPREDVKLEIRGGEAEVSRELPPPPPSRDGGAGGFTSING